MKRWLARSLALCTVLVTLAFVAGCGGGGGGGADSSSPATNNSSNTTAGVGFVQSGQSQTSQSQSSQLKTSQQTSNNSYETPEPATLSMLISGIVGAGGFLLYRKRRHG
jgi:hypothetical protein